MPEYDEYDYYEYDEIENVLLDLNSEALWRGQKNDHTSWSNLFRGVTHGQVLR